MNNLNLYYYLGGRRSGPPPDPTKLNEFMARMRANRGVSPILNDGETPTEWTMKTIDPDPAWRADEPALHSMGVRRPTSPFPGGVPGAPVTPDDPLRRVMPRAPLPPDEAAIADEERRGVEAELGPRIKENPGGWKGLLLGIAKGAAGLAEGYAASGERDWRDAVGSMAAGANRRIRDYQTNREDSVPFDEALNERIRARLEPLRAKYGRDRQVFEDDTARYRAGVEQDRYDDTKAAADRGEKFERDKWNYTTARQTEADKRDTQKMILDFTKDMDRNRLTFRASMAATQQRLQTAAASRADARQRDSINAHLRVSSDEFKKLDGRETAARTELKQIQTELDDISANVDGTDQEQLNRALRLRDRFQSVTADLAQIKTERESILTRMRGYADQIGAPAATGEGGGTAGNYGGAAAPVPPGIPLERYAEAYEIQQRLADGEITYDEAEEMLYDLGAAQ